MSQAVSAKPSYASGISDRPLLGDTIGANLARTVAAHGDGYSVMLDYSEQPDKTAEAIDAARWMNRARWILGVVDADSSSSDPPLTPTCVHAFAGGTAESSCCSASSR